jgi:hypothetical protein
VRAGEGSFRWAGGEHPGGARGAAEGLLASDAVAMEVTGGSWAIVRILEPQVKRVIVVSPGDTGITQARAKTDRLTCVRQAQAVVGRRAGGGVGAR